MKQRICPHCQNLIRPININEPVGVATCDHCGKEETIPNLLEHGDEGVATAQDHPGRFANTPPREIATCKYWLKRGIN